MCAVSFAIPSCFPALSTAAAAALLMLGGCAKTQSAKIDETVGPGGEVVADTADTVVAPEEPEQYRSGIHEQPLGGVASRGAAPMAVKKGAAPLLYLVDSPQTVQVVDE